LLYQALFYSTPARPINNRTNVQRSTALDGMSDTESELSEADPLWGSLAGERYLLHYWNSQSSETPDQQRQKLVQEFIQARQERLVPQLTPSATQITTILEPWRTSAQRDVVDTTSMDPAIWLRTCYSEGSDARHEELVDAVDMDNAVGGDHRLLNDPALYSYGSEWQQVFHVLPELLEPVGKDWIYTTKKQQDAVQELKDYAQAGLASVDQKLLDNLTGVAQGTHEIGFRGEELEEEAAKALQSTAHRAHVVTWLILEDEEALESGNVAVMFLDAHGKVVRSKRVPPDEAEQMGGFWSDGCWDEIGEWQDGEVGVEYSRGGACGGLLLESMREGRA
ncbi:MAG: hypothetical protein Q9220_007115, partial [cf. Caloplaca sp. 1 TL-2023]